MNSPHKRYTLHYFVRKSQSNAPYTLSAAGWLGTGHHPECVELSRVAPSKIRTNSSQISFNLDISLINNLLLLLQSGLNLQPHYFHHPFVVVLGNGAPKSVRACIKCDGKTCMYDVHKITRVDESF